MVNAIFAVFSRPFRARSAVKRGEGARGSCVSWLSMNSRGLLVLYFIAQSGDNSAKETAYVPLRNDNSFFQPTFKLQWHRFSLRDGAGAITAFTRSTGQDGT